MRRRAAQSLENITRSSNAPVRAGQQVATMVHSGINDSAAASGCYRDQLPVMMLLEQWVLLPTICNLAM